MAVIADLLRQREAAIKAFDEKLAKLGYHGNSGKQKRSHQSKKPTSLLPDAAGKPAGKSKA
jgi:hypothetical protein